MGEKLIHRSKKSVLLHSLTTSSSLAAMKSLNLTASKTIISHVGPEISEQHIGSLKRRRIVCNELTYGDDKAEGKLRSGQVG